MDYTCLLILIFILFFICGALPGKMLLVRIIENIKFMLILGQVRLSKG